VLFNLQQQSILLAILQNLVHQGSMPNLSASRAKTTHHFKPDQIHRGISKQNIQTCHELLFEHPGPF
jgi:hypothetical protein